MRFICICLFLFILTALSGCTPVVISKFDVDPEFLCEGNQVEVTWETTNATDVEITATPSVTPPIGSVGLDGSFTRNLNVSTTFEITARKDSSQKDLDDNVTVFSGSFDRNLLITPNCSGDVVQWTIEEPFNDWDPTARICTVRVNADRDITLVHGSRSQRIPGGGSTSTNAFDGDAPSGIWSITDVELKGPIGIPCHYEGCSNTTTAGADNDPVVLGGAGGVGDCGSYTRRDPPTFNVTVRACCP